MKTNKSIISPTKQSILALLLFILTIVLSRGSTIPALEVYVFNFIYGLPDFLNPVFLVITQFGSVHILAVLLVIYSIKKRYHILLRLLLTGGLAYILSGIAKDLWGRGRPNEFLDIMHLDVFRGSGFPSGHMAMATALAFTVGHYLPKKYSWVVPFWIISVGISRIILGVHFPMDVLGGFAIGWGAYALFRHVKLYDIKPAKRKSTK